jgi:hypothetical protein
VQKLDRAYTLLAVPTLGLWSARARAQVGHWLEAAERYRETIALSSTLGDSAAQDQAKSEARAELEKLQPRIPSFAIVLENASASEVVVTLDGTALPADELSKPKLANPGAHKLVATRGSERSEATLQLAEGQQQTGLLKFDERVELAAPTPPDLRLSTAIGQPSASAALGITVLTVGGLGLATAAVAALVANHKLNACGVVDGWHSCQEQWQLDNYNAAKTVATVAFWTGVGAAALGTTTLLLGTNEPEAHESQPTVSWTISPRSASLKATF